MATRESVLSRNAALDYFSHMNYMSKRIVTEDKTFIKYLGSRWNELPAQHKDGLLDLLFVDDNVRGFYNENRFARSTDDDNCEVQESFPRLFINSGNKINVDFENDLWTWRDEHSGPFSWMSRSQQDLTLLDLETDNILKPQPKSLKSDTEDEKTQKVAEPQFAYPSSSWCHSVLDDFKINEQNIVITPATSVNLIGVTTESSTDEADPGICGDTSSTSSPIHALNHARDKDVKDAAEESVRKSSGKDKNRRSPSPKKILRSGSFKKTSSKSSDHGEQKLITGDDPEMDDKANVFSNPVMESEWSTFVGHSNAEDLSSSEAQESSVTDAPESMTMDRGGYQAPYSPNGGEYVCLIEQTSSPAQASLKSATSPDVSEWSAQSTPDHNTHLLKGIQSPVHRKSTRIQSSFDTGYGQDLSGGVETEEVLRVEVEGDKIVVTTQLENQGDGDIPTTGFDFLDNW